MFLLNCMHAVFTSTRIFCVTSGFQTYSESGFPVDLSPQSLYFVDVSVSHHCGKSYPVRWTRVDDHFSIDVAQVGRIKNSPPPEEAVVILSEEKRMGNTHTPYTAEQGYCRYINSPNNDHNFESSEKKQKQNEPYIGLGRLCHTGGSIRKWGCPKCERGGLCHQKETKKRPRRNQERKPEKSGELYPTLPPIPHDQRHTKGDDPKSGTDPERQLPTTNPFTDPAVCVILGNIRVQQREWRCTEKWRE